MLTQESLTNEQKEEWGRLLAAALVVIALLFVAAASVAFLL